MLEQAQELYAKLLVELADTDDPDNRVALYTALSDLAVAMLNREAAADWAAEAEAPAQPLLPPWALGHN